MATQRGSSPNPSSTGFQSQERSSDDNQELSISKVARQVTRSSLTGDFDVNSVLSPQKNSKLDPFSPSFDATLWVRSFMQLLESRSGKVPLKKSGIAFRNLGVSGYSSGASYQKSTGNIPLSILSSAAAFIGNNRRRDKIEILRDFEGIVNDGEMLLVLGPPGSGCSTLLKTLAGQTGGLDVSPEAYLNYRGQKMPSNTFLYNVLIHDLGILPKHMHHQFRGDVLYNAELDVHLPHLTVGETLTFAARARACTNILEGLNAIQTSNIIRDVVMSVFGISHTKNTRVGDEYVRGVSGGERKRVSIAEAALTGARFQCWDNSTRGLDSQNAIQFCKNLRVQADYMGLASVVAIYQAPQDAYEVSSSEHCDGASYSLIILLAF